LNPQTGEAEMMVDPPAPGAVLAQYLEGLSLADAAAKIGIGQAHLSNLITGTASIDGNVATKLGRALGTSPDLWGGLQSAFDAWSTSAPMRDKTPEDSNVAFNTPPGTAISPSQMHQDPPVDEMAAWEAMAPIGREFGSPDYERLAELDSLAFKAMGTLLKARRWLDAPNAELSGLAPEEVAKTPEGFARVKELLRKATETVRSH
jgi:addiction module HigA family antidote